MDNNFINNNNELSSFNKEDLNYLFNLIMNILIEYRNKLNLSSYLTFGIEIEYEYLKHDKVDKYLLNNLSKWDSKPDLSLFFGGEVTSPIMTDEKEYWIELKNICNFLKKNDANVINNASGHVHIGADIFNNDLNKWLNFIKLYISYEHILYRFGYGECLNERKGLKLYSIYTGNSLLKKLEKIKFTNSMSDLEYLLDTDCSKYGGINFKHVCYNDKEKDRYNTIEFRFPNGTKNEIIWQNNINTFSKMVLAIVENKINPKFLDYKINKVKERTTSSEVLSKNICIEDALEFADLIFDNNLDKIYFLKQYFKNFYYVINKRYSQLTKKITKNK